MSAKFQNKYRIPPARLQHWDYGWNAAYFVTLCTKDREHYFGAVSDGKMELSAIGIIADLLWYEIKNHAPHVEFGEFQVMPNHIHGILILAGNNHDNNIGGTDDGGATRDVGEIRHVETTHALSPQQPNDAQYNEPQSPEKSIGQKRFQNQGKNTLSSIVGSYKSAVSKHAHRLGFDFEWQTRFHDHVISDDQSFQHISEYIINNPINWKDDRFNPSNQNAN